MENGHATTARLGLIGDYIADSQAPRLHGIAGRILGIAVRYDLLVPAEFGLGFDELFDRCTDGRYHGLNITHPYKERAAVLVDIENPLVRAMGAVNIVRVASGRRLGFNTDHSGFMGAWRAKFGAEVPGDVCLLGAGGAGRAIGFALGALGAESIRVVDVDSRRADGLAASLRRTFPALVASVCGHREQEAAAAGARGIVNCTPIGMIGHEGIPIPGRFMQGAAWAFDAVYTPVRTRFLAAASAAGLETISGFELFFHQGADGLAIHFGVDVDRARLREAMGVPDKTGAVPSPRATERAGG